MICNIHIHGLTITGEYHAARKNLNRREPQLTPSEPAQFDIISVRDADGNLLELAETELLEREAIKEIEGRY